MYVMGSAGESGRARTYRGCARSPRVRGSRPSAVGQRAETARWWLRTRCVWRAWMSGDVSPSRQIYTDLGDTVLYG